MSNVSVKGRQICYSRPTLSDIRTPQNEQKVALIYYTYDIHAVLTDYIHVCFYLESLEYHTNHDMFCITLKLSNIYMKRG